MTPRSGNAPGPAFPYSAWARTKWLPRRQQVARVGKATPPQPGRDAEAGERVKPVIAVRPKYEPF